MLYMNITKTKSNNVIKGLLAPIQCLLNVMTDGKLTVQYAKLFKAQKICYIDDMLM